MMRAFLALTALLALIVVSGCGDDNGSPLSPSNHAPIIQLQSDTLVALGDTLELWAMASDPDGHELEYTVSVQLTIAELKLGYWPDARIDKQSGHFWFRPQASDQPQRRFTFSVDDGHGGADSTTFSVAVS